MKTNLSKKEIILRLGFNNIKQAYNVLKPNFKLSQKKLLKILNVEGV